MLTVVKVTHGCYFNIRGDRMKTWIPFGFGFLMLLEDLLS